MAVVKSLIRAEKDGSISFGNHELPEKRKLSDFRLDGDIYKVKTYKDITKLERNEMLVYESVPGTTVTNFRSDEKGMSFCVEGSEDAEITLEAEPNAEYKLTIGDRQADDLKTNLGGKLSFSVELSGSGSVSVRIEKQSS